MALSEEMKLAIKLTAQDSTRQAFGSLNQSLNGLKNAAVAAAATIGSALALRDVVASMQRVGDDVGLLRDELGLSAREASKWNVAAHVTGLTAQDISTTFGALNRKLIEQLPLMEEGKDDFSKWGVAVKDASGNVLSMEDILENARAVINALPPGLARSGAAMDIFGRSGKELIDFLTIGQDEMQSFLRVADEWGLLLDEDGTDALKSFSREMRFMELQTDAAKLAIGRQLLPVLKMLLDLLRRGAGAFKVFAEAMRGPLGLVKEMADRFGSFLAAVKEGGLLTAVTDLVKDIGSKLDELGPLGTLAKAALIALGAAEVVGAVGRAAQGVAGIVTGLRALPARTVLLVDIVLVGVAIDEVQKTLGELTSKWEKWRTAAHEGLLENQGAVGTFVKGLVLLGDDFQRFGTMVRGIFTSVSNDVGIMFESLGTLIQRAISAISFDIGPFHLHDGVFTVDQINLGPVVIGGGVVPITGGVGLPPSLPGTEGPAIKPTRREGRLTGAGFVGTFNGTPVTADSAAAIRQFGGVITPFAEGGIVARPTLGLIGERGPEAIVPLSRGGGMGPTINVYVSGNVTRSEQELAEIVAARIVRRMRGTGQPIGSPTSIGGFW